MRDQQHSPGERRDGVLRAARRSAALAIPVLILIFGCANQIAETSGPTPGNTMPDHSERAGHSDPEPMTPISRS